MPVSEKPRRPKRLQHTRRQTFKGMRFATLMERTINKRGREKSFAWLFGK